MLYYLDELIYVGIVVCATTGLDRLPHHSESQRVDANRGQQLEVLRHKRMVSVVMLNRRPPRWALDDRVDSAYTTVTQLQLKRWLITEKALTASGVHKT